MKLKYITRLSLACGVMITAVAFSGCSGSAKAVQANAAVMSSSGVMSTEPNSEVSEVSSNSILTSSDLVSHAAPSVSSAVAVSGGVGSQRPSSNNSNSTSHQAPTTSRPSNGGGSTSRPASTRPASTAPTPKPASQAPASRPVSTAPVEAGVSAKYYGATYGCDTNSQYNYVLQKAEAITSSSAYAGYFSDNKSGFEDFYGIPYSDQANMVASIIGCIKGGSGSSGSGSAYAYFTGSSSYCGDKAKAIQAALHVNGIPCKLVWGKNARGQSHMWTEFEINGTWYQWGSTFSKGTPSGYSVSGSGYNY